MRNICEHLPSSPFRHFKLTKLYVLQNLTFVIDVLSFACVFRNRNVLFYINIKFVFKTNQISINFFLISRSNQRRRRSINISIMVAGGYSDTVPREFKFLINPRHRTNTSQYQWPIRIIREHRKYNRTFLKPIRSNKRQRSAKWRC